MSTLISDEISNFEYQYDDISNWVITISGASDIAINDDSMINWTNISEINFGSEIIKIGACCCAGIELEKVTMQDTVTDIGPYAFYWTFISEIKLSENLKSLGEMAFFYSNLQSIIIPKKISEIPYQCFCANRLTSITLQGQISSFSEGCFAVNSLSSIPIQSSLKIIDDDAFAYNDFESINIPDTVSFVGAGAFQSNDNLSSVTLPNNLCLSSNPFYNCPKLSSLTCFNIDFSKSHFRKAGNEIAIADKLIIGIDGNDCGSGLSDPNITSIGPFCYAYNTYNPKDGWYLNLSEKNNITEIGRSAFEFCKGLKQINLGNQIITIDEDAFNNCDLTAIDNISNKLYQFNSRLFCGNRNLSSICIPQSVSAIYDSCFSYCSSLVSVIMSGDYESVPVLHGTIFSDCQPLSIYVKDDKNVNLFSNADGWKDMLSSGQVEFISMHRSITIGTNNLVHQIDVIELSGEVDWDEYIQIGRQESISGDIINNVDIIYISSDQTCKCTSIGNNAFCMCNQLSSVILPTISSLGESSFDSCNNLIELSIPNVILIDSYALYGCEKLNSINLPKATSIGELVFSGCESLSSIYVNNSTLHSIGNGYGIDNQIVVNDDETELIAIVGAITQISNSAVTSINAYTFENCISLRSADFQTVSSIGDSVFFNCESLSSVNIPKVSSIGEYAFRYCTSLIATDFSNATSIGSQAFYMCESLSSVNIPKVSSIDSSTFCYCSSLITISLPNAISIGFEAFYRCTSLSSVNIPEVSSISYNAFKDCESLSSIYVNNSTLHSIGNGYGIDNQIVVNDDETELIAVAGAIIQLSSDTVTEIGSEAFYNCKNLSSIDIPKATSIGELAFYFCSSLSSMSFPEVTSISQLAFSYCTSLKSIFLENKTKIATLQNINAFFFLPTDYKVYVPEDLYNQYIVATNWSHKDVVNHIIAIPKSNYF